MSEAGRPKDRATLFAAYRATSAMPDDARRRVEAALLATPPRKAVRTSHLRLIVGTVALAFAAAGIATIRIQATPAAVVREERRLEAPHVSDHEADEQRARPHEPPHRRTRAAAPRPAPALEVVPDATESRHADTDAQSDDPPPRRPRPLPRRAATRRPAPLAEPPTERPADGPVPSNLAHENRLLTDAWAHVTERRYAKAKASLSEHLRRFPHGVLTPERQTLAIVLDCVTKPTAQRDLEMLERMAAPHLRSKVREACARSTSISTP